MTQATRKSEERLQEPSRTSDILELLGSAEALFMDRGFDNVQVMDVARHLEVPLDTLQRHFGSKEALINAIIMTYPEEICDGIMKIQTDPDLDAVEKIKNCLQYFRVFGTSHERFLEYLQKEQNSIIFCWFRQHMLHVLSEPFIAIVRQGIEEGVFSTNHPREAAVSILGILGKLVGINHHYVDLFDIHNRSIEQIIPILHFTERILGTRPGVFLNNHAENCQGIEILCN